MISSSSKIFYVNSRNKQSGDDSDFTFKIDFPTSANYDKVVVLDASIPKSYYLVQAGYNSFTLVEGLNTVTVTLTEGNYVIKSLTTELVTRLNAASPGGFIYGCTYPPSSLPQDGKLRFTVSNNLTVQPSFVFGPSAIHYLCGFHPDTTNTFNSNALKSTHVINLQRETSLYLHSDLVANDNDDILQELFAQETQDFSSITYTNVSPELSSKSIATNSSNQYYFRLTNQDNKIIDLNGLPLLLTICCYKSSPVYDLIKKVAKVYLIDIIEHENHDNHEKT